MAKALPANLFACSIFSGFNPCRRYIAAPYGHNGRGRFSCRTANNKSFWWLLSSLLELLFHPEVMCMDVIEKILHTYGINPEHHQEARERLVEFLSDKTDDAHHCTVEGLRFLRGERFHRTRRARSSV